MNIYRRKFLSQLCCGFRIQLRVSGWHFFVMITGCSRFTCLQGCVCSFEFSRVCYFILDSLLVLFELQYTRRIGPYSQDEVWLLIF